MSHSIDFLRIIWYHYTSFLVVKKALRVPLRPHLNSKFRTIVEKLIGDHALSRRSPMYHKRIAQVLSLLLIIMLTGCGVGASTPVEERGAKAYQEAQQALLTYERTVERQEARSAYRWIADNYVFPEGEHFKVLPVYPVLFSNEVQLFKDPHGILKQFDLEKQKLELYGTSDVQTGWRLCAAWDEDFSTQVVLTPEECAGEPK